MWDEGPWYAAPISASVNDNCINFYIKPSTLEKRIH